MRTGGRCQAFRRKAAGPAGADTLDRQSSAGSLSAERFSSMRSGAWGATAQG